MPEPTATEVIPKAVVKERISAIPATGSAEAMAKKIADAVNSGSWREGLDAAKRKVDTGVADKRIEQIGATYNATTGVKERTTGSGSEAERHSNAKEAINDVKEFLEKGLDGYSKKTALVDAALDRFKLRPLIASELTALPNDAQRKAFVERMLKDPRTAGAVQKLMAERLEGNFDDTTILAALDAVAGKEIDKENAQAEYNDANARVSNVDARLKPFTRPRTGTLGTKAQDIEDLKRSLPTLQADIPLKKGNMQRVQSRVELLTEEFRASQQRGWTGRPSADIFTELGTAKSDFGTAQSELAEVEGKIKRLSDLEAEETNLKEEKRTLTAELRQKKAALDRANLDLAQRRRDSEAAKTLRSTQENDFVVGLETILIDAAESTLDDDITKATEKFDKDLETLKAKATSDKDKAFYDSLQKIWLGNERTRKIGLWPRRRTEKYRPIDKTKVYDYFSTLITDGDEAMFRRVLSQTKNPATGINYIPAEIDELVKDETFTNKMKPEAVKQLLGRKFLAGGVTQEDIHIITNASWGRGMIDQALQSNEEFRENVKKVMGADALNRHGFMERFGQVAKDHPWWIALIVGIPFAIAAAKGMSVTNEAVHSQMP